MAVTFWAEAGLSNSSEVRQIDDWSFSLQTNLRGALDDEHLFSSSTGTADRGIHRPGSGRAFVAAQSALSTSNTTQGRLFFASNTSRLFATPVSGATAFIGSGLVPEVGGYRAIGVAPAVYYDSNVRWRMETGFGRMPANSNRTFISYQAAYGVAPVVLLTAFEESSINTRVTINLFLNGASGFTCDTFRGDGSATTNTVDFGWLSIGTLGF